jgi:hypothetical protein
VFEPLEGQFNSAAIIFTRNPGNWDFYYDCCMPETITIDGLKIEETAAPSNYNGVYLVRGSSPGSGSYPFTLTKTIYLSGFESAKAYRWENNLGNSIQVIKN